MSIILNINDNVSIQQPNSAMGLFISGELIRPLNELEEVLVKMVIKEKEENVSRDKEEGS